jgi:hypothetical protein
MTAHSAPQPPIDIDRLEEALEGSEALFLEPRASFDSAIVGLAERINLSVVAYDRQLVIKALMADSGMDRDEAVEFYEFNIAGAWMGEGTPVFLDSLRGGDEDDEDGEEPGDEQTAETGQPGLERGEPGNTD